MDKQTIKTEICSFIDRAGARLEEYTGSVLREPELGFKEFKTAAKTAAFFRSLGFSVQEGLALTGVKGTLKGTPGGPVIAIIGEMDAVGCPEAPFADPLTGAAHVCGHFLQLGAMLGAAAGLAGLFDKHKLCGDIVFFAAPAEEYVEIAYRAGLKKQGKIHFLGGKQELLYLDAFAGVDMALMVHANGCSPASGIYIGESSNGFLGKEVRYIGRQAHAAAAPEEGINALNAAMLGLMNIHALRETFKDADHIRVHPIITKGGDLVNSVPADVRLETYVRGKTMAAIENTHQKIDRALRAGGDAVGARTVIHTMPGYLPLVCSKEMNDIFLANARLADPNVKIYQAGHFSGSTDMGDLCHVMPAIHPYAGGVTGALHGRDFALEDFAAACLLPAKALAMSAADYLYDGAALGKKIIKEYRPLLTRTEYINKMDQYFS